MAQLPLVPPLVELGRELNWEPLPLTIKEGRRLPAAPCPGWHRPWRPSRRPPSFPQPVAPAAPAEPVISVHDLHYAYHGHRAARADLRGAARRVRGTDGAQRLRQEHLLKALVGLLTGDEGRVTYRRPRHPPRTDG